VYEGRGWDVMGTHAPKYNSRSIGICFIGDFRSKSSDLIVTLTLVMISKTKNCTVEWFRIPGLLLSKSRGTNCAVERCYQLLRLYRIGDRRMYDMK